jgi:hypothetical protein
MQSVADTFAMDALHHALPGAHDFDMDDAACAAAVAPLPLLPWPFHLQHNTKSKIFVKRTGDELFIRCELRTWRDDLLYFVKSTVTSFVTAVGSESVVVRYSERFDVLDVTEFSVRVIVRRAVSAEALRENLLVLLRTFRATGGLNSTLD